jgi:hypothetical protein
MGPAAPGSPIAWPVHRLQPTAVAEPKPLRASPQKNAERQSAYRKRLAEMRWQFT